MVLQRIVLLACLILVPILAERLDVQKLISGAQARVDFIRGGSAVKKGEFPNFVSIEQDGERYCAGTLITKNWVLTSAACVKSNDKPVTIKLGVITSNADVKSIPITKMVKHEDAVAWRNNIAMMKFEEKITFNNTVSAKGLTQNAITQGQTVNLISFSNSNETKTPQGYPLYKVNEKTLNNTECEKKYFNQVTFANDTLCAQGENREGGCFEDIGSPLYNPSTKRIVGIYFGRIPCAPMRPDVYTDIFTFIPWIKKTLKDNRKQ